MNNECDAREAGNELCESCDKVYSDEYFFGNLIPLLDEEFDMDDDDDMVIETVTIGNSDEFFKDFSKLIDKHRDTGTIKEKGMYEW